MMLGCLGDVSNTYTCHWDTLSNGPLWTVYQPELGDFVFRRKGGPRLTHCEGRDLELGGCVAGPCVAHGPVDTSRRITLDDQ